MIINAKTATLATTDAAIPHAALVTVGCLPDFTPILLLSELAIHTCQLQANPNCALLLTGVAPGPNPQTTPRLCLTGTASKTDNPAARAVFLASHPYATGYVDFADFAFWQIATTQAYYIGGFAAASALDPRRLCALE